MGWKNRQRSFLDTLSQQELGRRAEGYNALRPQYTGLLDSGYSPEEQSAIEQGTVGGVRGAYDTARDVSANRLARTRNEAGYGNFMSELARQEGRDVSEAGLRNKVLFADEKLRRKQIGLQGLANLYGVNTNFLTDIGQQQLSLESMRRGKMANFAMLMQGLGGQSGGAGLAGAAKAFF